MSKPAKESCANSDLFEILGLVDPSRDLSQPLEVLDKSPICPSAYYHGSANYNQAPWEPREARSAPAAVPPPDTKAVEMASGSSSAVSTTTTKPPREAAVTDSTYGEQTTVVANTHPTASVDSEAVTLRLDVLLAPVASAELSMVL